MVKLSIICFSKTKKVFRNYLKSNFRDSLKLVVSGGSGGNGYPKYGGIGGQGGDVKFIAKENTTLHELFRKNKSKQYKADNGRHSSHNFILGPPGNSLNIEVPIGVTIYSEDGIKVGELNEENEELLVVKGGVGGSPKTGFLGMKGQTKGLILDLKLIADVGLVGFPNAGKSTLLKNISQAKPKIASYPFTTVRPILGTVVYNDDRQIKIADLPGLIEGAYANKGMGHKFLKHVERTKILLLIVDINGFQLSPEYSHRSCFETIILLNKELELYNKDLLQKPAILLINKMDTTDSQIKLKEVEDSMKNLKEILLNYPDTIRPETLINFHDVMPISAKENECDIEKVKQKLRHLLDVVDDLENIEKIEKNASLYEDLRKSVMERGPHLV